jgi:hypothetical protein
VETSYDNTKQNNSENNTENMERVFMSNHTNIDNLVHHSCSQNASKDHVDQANPIDELLSTSNKTQKRKKLDPVLQNEEYKRRSLRVILLYKII